MPLPDIETSRAVLIGTAGYRHLPPLPAVAVNLEGLAARLRDPEVWGLPAEHCSVVLDPASPDELLEVVHRAAREATDTLLIYYAGHGLLDRQSELLLTLTGSDRERMYRSVRYADLRREVLDAVRCRAKAVILDCCLDHPGARHLADQAVIDGTWQLTAVAGSVAAFAPPGEPGTAFTGELLDVLDRGIADGPALIDTDALYLRIRNGLAAKQRPCPRQRAAGSGRLIAFVRNRAVDAAPEPVPPRVNELPYLRMAPAALAEKVEALRSHGHPDAALAVLAGCGRRRPGQEVASIMVTLASLRRPRDVAAVAFAAAGRDPHELRQILEVLLEIEQRAVAAGLLKVVAAGLPERTARFAAVLDEAGPAVGDALAVLLRSAVGFATGKPQRVIDLLTSLFLARRDTDADLVLAEAQRVLPPADLAAVADALRDADREEQAYVLYGRAATAVAGRPPAQVATIVAALFKGGDADTARSLARQAVAARGGTPVAGLAELIIAFETAGLDEVVAEAVTSLSGALPGPELAEVTRELRERGGARAALRVYSGAVADRDIDEILRLHASLTDQGRPIDALRLLEHAAQVRSIAEVDRMTRDPHPPGSDRRNRRVFAALAARQPGRTAALYRLLGRLDDGRLEQLRAEVLRRPEPDVVAVAAELLRTGATDLADDLLRAALRQIDAMTPAKLAAVAVRGRRWDTVLRLAVVSADDELPSILHELHHGLPEPGVAAATLAPLLAGLGRRTIAAAVPGLCALDPQGRGAHLMNALAARPAAELATVIAAVTRPGSVQTADELLTAAARGPVRDVVELIGELRGRGERAHLRTLMEVFREHHRDRNDLFKLAGWLWTADEHDLARLLLRGRLWLAESAIRDARATAVADLLHEHAVRTGRLDQAFPVIMRAEDAGELLGTYRVGGDRLCLLVLSSARARRLTPVLFTEGGVQHVNGDRFGYGELRETTVAAGPRNTVLFSAPPDRRTSWTMPSAGAAKELAGLLAEIRALTADFEDDVREAVPVPAEPVAEGLTPRYELDGEAS